MMRLTDKKARRNFDKAASLIHEAMYLTGGGLCVLPYEPPTNLAMVYKPDTFEDRIGYLATAVFAVAKFHQKTRTEMLSMIHEQLIELEKRSKEVMK